MGSVAVKHQRAGKHHDRDPGIDGVLCPRPVSQLARMRVGFGW
jgi:hypothetical protein